jgi:hypothetical protein
MFASLLQREVAEVLGGYGRIDLQDRTSFLCNLVFVYHAIKASENLLKMASEEEKDCDLASYFYRHIDEEQGHVEWLAEDLLTAGIVVEKTIIPSSVVEMVGSVYYLIQHVEPAALLGYQLMMECFPLSPRQLEELEDIHGKSLLRTARYHSAHDPDHAKELMHIIDTLPNERRWIVSQVAMKSAHYFGKGLAGVRHVGRERSESRGTSATH